MTSELVFSRERIERATEKAEEKLKKIQEDEIKINYPMCSCITGDMFFDSPIVNLNLDGQIIEFPIEHSKDSLDALCGTLLNSIFIERSKKMLVQIAILRVSDTGAERGFPKEEILVQPYTALVRDKAEAQVAALIDNAEKIKDVPREELEIVCLGFTPIRLTLR